MHPLTSTPLIRRLAAFLSIAFVAALGFGATSASAHTFSASGKCGVANLKWVSFAGSGTTPANKPDWKIVKDAAPTSLASGQFSFTGTSGNLDVNIPSSNGSYVASSSWTAGNTRDGNAGSGSSTFKLSSCDQITTTASPTVALGGDVSDTAQLSGATANAGGTIKFQLYSDTDTTCKTPLATSSTVVSGNGSYKSGTATPGVAGGYQWTATYSGDSNNDAVGPHGCGVAAEHVTVTPPPVNPPPPPVVKPTPALTTTASPKIKVGKEIHDTAHLSGGTDDISGTITFELFRIADTTCATPIATGTTTVAGNGDYDSPSVKPAKAGKYQWTANYSGDTKNQTTGAKGCGDPAEQVTVGKKDTGGVKSACRVGPGRLRVFGPSGNVRKSFDVKVKSSGFSRLTIFVDGKASGTKRQGSIHNGTFTFHVNARNLKPGVHKLRVVGGAGPKRCGTTAQGLRFVRAKPAVTTPEFTG